jgi:hypothetical protein
MRNWIDILNETAGITFDAYRYHSEINRYSTEFRLGTWYATNEKAVSRYHNPDGAVKLGGDQLLLGTITCQNPFYIQCSNYGVLYDAWQTVPFGDKIVELVYAKTKSEIMKAAATLVPAPLLRQMIKLSEFNTKTMVTERVAVEWCRANGHDLIVIGETASTPRELLDFENLFVSRQ